MVSEQNLPTIRIAFYNLIFLTVTIGLMVLYMSVKHRALLNPFENYFGLGDLVFLAAVTPLFLLKNYVFFFIISLLISIGLHTAFVKHMTYKTVPLAGYVALCLMIVTLGDFFGSLPKVTLIPNCL